MELQLVHECLQPLTVFRVPAILCQACLIPVASSCQWIVHYIHCIDRHLPGMHWSSLIIPCTCVLCWGRGWDHRLGLCCSLKHCCYSLLPSCFQQWHLICLVTVATLVSQVHKFTALETFPHPNCHCAQSQWVGSVNGWYPIWSVGGMP